MDYTKMKAQDIGDALLRHVHENCSSGEIDVDELRRGVGCMLSSIHSIIIHDHGKDGVFDAMDTIGRLTKCMQNDIERFNIEGVRIETGVCEHEEDCEHDLPETIQ